MASPPVEEIRLGPYFFTFRPSAHGPTVTIPGMLLPLVWPPDNAASLSLDVPPTSAFVFTEFAPAPVQPVWRVGGDLMAEWTVPPPSPISPTTAMTNLAEEYSSVQRIDQTTPFLHAVNGPSPPAEEPPVAPIIAVTAEPEVKPQPPTTPHPGNSMYGPDIETSAMPSTSLGSPAALSPPTEAASTSALSPNQPLAGMTAAGSSKRRVRGKRRRKLPETWSEQPSTSESASSLEHSHEHSFDTVPLDDAPPSPKFERSPISRNVNSPTPSLRRSHNSVRGHGIRSANASSVSLRSPGALRTGSSHASPVPSENNLSVHPSKLKTRSMSFLRDDSPILDDPRSPPPFEDLTNRYESRGRARSMRILSYGASAASRNEHASDMHSQVRHSSSRLDVKEPRKASTPSVPSLEVSENQLSGQGQGQGLQPASSDEDLMSNDVSSKELGLHAVSMVEYLSPSDAATPPRRKATSLAETQRHNSDTLQSLGNQGSLQLQSEHGAEKNSEPVSRQPIPRQPAFRPVSSSTSGFSQYITCAEGPGSSPDDSPEHVADRHEEPCTRSVSASGSVTPRPVSTTPTPGDPGLNRSFHRVNASDFPAPVGLVHIDDPNVTIASSDTLRHPCDRSDRSYGPSLEESDVNEASEEDGYQADELESEDDFSAQWSSPPGGVVRKRSQASLGPDDSISNIDASEVPSPVTSPIDEHPPASLHRLIDDAFRTPERVQSPLAEYIESQFSDASGDASGMAEVSYESSDEFADFNGPMSLTPLPARLSLYTIRETDRENSPVVSSSRTSWSSQLSSGSSFGHVQQ